MQAIALLLKKIVVRLGIRSIAVTLLFFPAPFLAAQPGGSPHFAQPAQPARPAWPIQSTLAARKPFPQHVAYGAGIHLPDHLDRQQLDDSVRFFYATWEKRYIRKGCGDGEYYVWFEEPGAKQCVSEGQGYGMMITALMAGPASGDSSKKIFDGLYHYYRAHPARTDTMLMAWAQKKDCLDLDGSSATDGDMDIAYSLLLADAQWGSAGPVDYAEEGRRMIAAILRREINKKNFSVLLSDDVEPDSKDYADMRSSDFMPAHFRAFRQASGDPVWDTVIANNYRLFRFMQERYSPGAGLLPDFITGITIPRASAPAPGSADPASPGNDDFHGPATLHPRPARPHYLESRYDGCYYYNACRVPWRIATDLILNKDPQAGLILEKINRWIRSTTAGNPDNISAGYSLDGNDLPRHYFEALSFIAPFAVSAMTDQSPGGQAWLNKLWDYLLRFRLRQFDYYDNSIKMIGLIILSGNYWAP